MATMAPTALSEPIPDTGPTAQSPGRLNEWAFYLPYLASVVAYFVFIDSGARVLAPAVVPAVVLAAVFFRMLVRQPVAINSRVVWMIIVWGMVSTVTLLWTEADSYYSVRKVTLPLMCMAPGIFRFSVTRNGALAFAILLGIVGVLYTTQSADTVSEGFSSTDSPYESILGVAFGIYTVWLVGSAAPLAAAAAYAFCVLFFKRNAIVVAPVVGMVGIAIGQLRQDVRLKLMKAGIVLIFIASPIIAFYLNDIYDWLADNVGSFSDAESLSSGRTLLYLVIITQIDHASLTTLFFGHGAGSVEQLVSTTGLISVNLGLAHNEYLSLIFDFGIVGFVFIVGAFLRCADNLRSAMVVLFVSIAMSGENFFLITFSCLIMFFLFSAELQHRPTVRPD